MVLEGYATYMAAAAGAIVTGLYILGLIDKTTWEMLMGLIVSGGAAALRRSISKVPDKVATETLVVAKKLAKEENVDCK
jgi:hypothetical protein